MHIEFKNVFFKYKNKEILKGISFNAQPSTTTFILGETGAGKSTIAKLLMRFFDVNQGEIFINGKNIKKISFDSLYQTIGYVSQETEIFNDSLKSNINMLNDVLCLEKIKKALELSQLSITDLNEELNKILGEGGKDLSGGEKQRICLARMFVKNPKICIFDEPTASLDKKTGTKLMKNIRTIFSHSTNIIITHDESLIKPADSVFYLKDGLLLKKN